MHTSKDTLANLIRQKYAKDASFKGKFKENLKGLLSNPSAQLKDLAAKFVDPKTGKLKSKEFKTWLDKNKSKLVGGKGKKAALAKSPEAAKRMHKEYIRKHPGSKKKPQDFLAQGASSKRDTSKGKEDKPSKGKGVSSQQASKASDAISKGVAKESDKAEKSIMDKIKGGGDKKTLGIAAAAIGAVAMLGAAAAFLGSDAGKELMESVDLDSVYKGIQSGMDTAKETAGEIKDFFTPEYKLEANKSIGSIASALAGAEAGNSIAEAAAGGGAGAIGEGAGAIGEAATGAGAAGAGAAGGAAKALGEGAKAVGEKFKSIGEGAGKAISQATKPFEDAAAAAKGINTRAMLPGAAAGAAGAAAVGAGAAGAKALKDRKNKKKKSVKKAFVQSRNLAYAIDKNYRKEASELKEENNLKIATEVACTWIFNEEE